jgi:hypothetical protein
MRSDPDIVLSSASRFAKSALSMLGAILIFTLRVYLFAKQGNKHGVGSMDVWPQLCGSECCIKTEIWVDYVENGVCGKQFKVVPIL